MEKKVLILEPKQYNSLIEILNLSMKLIGRDCINSQLENIGSALNGVTNDQVIAYVKDLPSSNLGSN